MDAFSVLHTDRTKCSGYIRDQCSATQNVFLIIKTAANSFINPRRACAARVTGQSVCPSVRNLTSGASVRPEKDITYTKIKIFLWISLKPLRCRDTPFSALYGYPCSRPFWKPRMRIISVRVRFHGFAHA